MKKCTKSMYENLRAGVGAYCCLLLLIGAYCCLLLLIAAYLPLIGPYWCHRRTKIGLHNWLYKPNRQTKRGEHVNEKHS